LIGSKLHKNQSVEQKLKLARGQSALLHFALRKMGCQCSNIAPTRYREGKNSYFREQTVAAISKGNTDFIFWENRRLPCS